jgi:hypothetical protein
MTLHLLVVLRLRIPKRLFLSQKEVPTWRYINSKSGRILPFGREEIRILTCVLILDAHNLKQMNHMSYMPTPFFAPTEES